jgi:hypothetical protein
VFREEAFEDNKNIKMFLRMQLEMTQSFEGENKKSPTR